jgi:hypothetical protein
MELFLEEPMLSYVRWLLGVVPDKSVPQYLVHSQRPSHILCAAITELDLKIGDMGVVRVNFLCCEMISN